MTSALSAAGAALAAFPFIQSMQPSARARAEDAPVRVDLRQIPPGWIIVTQWRRQPVFVVSRTDAMLSELKKHSDRLRDPDSLVPQQPEYITGFTRSFKEKYLVLIGKCTHLGCAPHYRPEVAPSDLGEAWPGGFFCPCHGSIYDLSGRVFKNVLASTNLVVPPHKFEGDETVVIGVDPEIFSQVRS